MSSLGWATNFNFFRKQTKKSQSKGVFPVGIFERTQNTNHLPYDASYSNDNTDVIPTLATRPKKSLHLTTAKILIYRYVEAWLYFARPGQHFSSPINRCKILPLHGWRLTVFEEISRKCYWRSFCFFLTVQHLLMKLLLEKLQAIASLVLGLMLADYNPTRSVNLCQPVHILIGISIQGQVDSCLDKTTHLALKFLSFPGSKGLNQNIKQKPSLKHAKKKPEFFTVHRFRSHCNTAFDAMR